MASRKERFFYIDTFEMNYETVLHSHFNGFSKRKRECSKNEDLSIDGAKF